jgi:serpin B
MKKNMLFIAIIVLLGYGTLSSSCKKNIQQPDILKPIVLPPAGTSGIIQANTDFAFDFWHTVLQNDSSPVNKMVSPLSIYLALSMLYNGADHATRDSIQYALRLNGISIEDLNNTCKALLQQMPLVDNEVNLSIANSIWYDKSQQPLQSFLNVNDSFYNAGIQALNFGDPASVTTINDWVSKQTHGKITQIIDQLAGVLCLVNAVYFKGSWTAAFDKKATANASFTTAEDKTVSAPFMFLHSFLRYFGNDSLQMVQLPYGGGNFNMYVLLPRTNMQVTQLAAVLNRPSFANWQAHLDSTDVQLFLPKFQYSYSIDNMLPELSAMGMGIAFSDAADLTKIYSGGAQVNQAIHKTYINVDETGTEAAAATAVNVGGNTSPAPPLMLRFDHPFLYVIQEKTSGVILFIGQVNDPTQS